MNNKVKVVTKNKIISQIEVKRPAYIDVASSYMDIFPADTTIDSVIYAYIYIGGKVSSERERAPSSYGNACALRVSYALNFSGAKIPKKSDTLPYTVQGGQRILAGGDKYIVNGDKYYYIYAVKDLVIFLTKNWGNPEADTKVIKGSNMLETLKKMNAKGVIIFYISGYSDATGHATIWDGSQCLDGSTYYDPASHPKQTLTEILFWELK